ncbi:hypothetical protein FRC12_001240 [Ceratobasidium sp. 428]|nr:hypothetical protein FRC12_001240 [Ceratobasidium sp. 428]
MFGRYLLFPHYLRNNVPNIVDKAPDANSATFWEAGIEQVERIADALEAALRQSKTPRLFDGFYPDWYKTLIFLQRDTHAHLRGSYLYEISEESETTWIRVGLGLGFLEHIKHGAGKYTCMYARCPTPIGARFQSGSESYCSARCQAA